MRAVQDRRSTDKRVQRWQSTLSADIRSLDRSEEVELRHSRTVDGMSWSSPGFWRAPRGGWISNGRLWVVIVGWRGTKLCGVRAGLYLMESLESHRGKECRLASVISTWADVVGSHRGSHGFVFSITARAIECDILKLLYL